jgi:O-antigen biosynthesis protein
LIHSSRRSTLRPDFRLQEAGCLVFRNGEARQLGCREWPTDWRYQTLRDVDYCSGASIIIRRSFWDSVQGFDPRFAPAYYEDTDLAATAKSRGLRVVYQPQSVLFHNEGTTHGRDFSGVKSFQLRNQKLFAEKWSDWLLSKPDNPQNWTIEDEMKLRDQGEDPMVIVIDHRVPTPTEDSGSVRMSSILDLLSDLGFRVALVPGDGVHLQPASTEMRRKGVEVVAVHPQSLEFGAYLRAVKERVEFVIACRPDTALSALGPVTQNLPLTPLVYDMVDAHGLRKRGEAEVTGAAEDLQEALRVESLERRVAQASDIVVTLSQADEEEILRLAGGGLKTVRVSNIHRSVEPGPGFDERKGLLFVGGYEHSPNVDAVIYFVREILPLICRGLGSIPVTLAGSKPTSEVLALAGGDVTVTGWVEDLTDLYHRARVVVAPLRFGAGVKGKIGEAMSHGVPVVSTSVGVSGMFLSHGENVLIGDDSEEFARGVTELYQDADLWTTIQSRAIETVETRFGWEHARGQVTALVELARSLRRGATGG